MMYLPILNKNTLVKISLPIFNLYTFLNQCEIIKLELSL